MKKYRRVSKYVAVIVALAVIIPLAVSCGEEEAPVTPTNPTPTSTATTVARTGKTATVSTATGEVQMLELGTEDWYSASAGTKLYTGDSLKTGDDGYALIVFHEGSIMELEANSEIQVDELATSASGSTVVRIKQIVGSAISRVEKLVDSASIYEVVMPAGTAVVRGTDYMTRVFGGIGFSCVSTLCADGSSNCAPVPNCQEGDHCVRLYGNGKYSDVFVDIGPNMEGCCWPGQQPTGPFYADPNDDPFNLDPGSSGGYYDQIYDDFPYQDSDYYCFP